jgi:hypothetical protein
MRAVVSSCATRLDPTSPSNQPFDVERMVLDLVSGAPNDVVRGHRSLSIMANDGAQVDRWQFVDPCLGRRVERPEPDGHRELSVLPDASQFVLVPTHQTDARVKLHGPQPLCSHPDHIDEVPDVLSRRPATRRHRRQLGPRTTALDSSVDAYECVPRDVDGVSGRCCPRETALRASRRLRLPAH